MGYTCDFIGHIDIAPALNEREIDYLNAFSGSRRWERPDGPYGVPRDPRAEDSDRARVLAHSRDRGSDRGSDRGGDPARDPARDHGGGKRREYHRPPEGQPSLWCDWVPCWEGSCLSYAGVEKFYGAATWLRYLIDHFLRPGAVAAQVGDARLAGFTFDHVLDGMVIGCRRDTRELFALIVRANAVHEDVLRRGALRHRGRPLLPYEAVIDRDLSPAQRQRRQREGQVLTFTRGLGA